MEAPLPDNESLRLEALRALEMLNTPPEQDFDGIVRLAVHVCGTHAGVISLIDSERQWFKARTGLDMSQTSRSQSICAHTILGGELLEIPDTLADEHFREHPAASASGGVRFYAGVPLLLHDRYAIGTLCVFDENPGHLDEQQKEALQTLAHQTCRLFELKHRILTEKNLKNELIHRLELDHISNEARDSYIAGDPPARIFQRVLKATLEATQSEFGFMGEVFHDEHGARYLQSHAITDISWNDETRALYAASQAQGMRFTRLDSLFGVTLLTGETVISDDPSSDPRKGGLPPGHPRLNCYLGLPIRLGDELVGMIGLANRPGGYTTSLAETLEPLTLMCSGLIRSMRIERQRNELQQQVMRELQSEILLREVHHRVKNNMQVICSMLDLQSRRLPDVRQRSVFTDCRERIRAMSLIHERLYATHCYDRIDFADYLREMAPLIVDSNIPHTTHVQIDLKLTPLDVSLDLASPLALIASEILLNSIKHGFSQRTEGRLEIVLDKQGTEGRLMISDDGPGLVSSERERPPESLGMQLIDALTRQIHGRIELGSAFGGLTTIIHWRTA
jgi:two-component sensor histidine kinase